MPHAGARMPRIGEAGTDVGSSLAGAAPPWMWSEQPWARFSQMHTTYTAGDYAEFREHRSRQMANKHHAAKEKMPMKGMPPKPMPMKGGKGKKGC